jgi:hypothetical protein
LTSLILESLSFISTSGAIGLGVGGKGGKVGDNGIWNGLNGSGHGSKGVQPATENEADRSLFVLGSDSFVSLGGSSTHLGSGELLLSCILALLGHSSASLYSDASFLVSGSESGKQKIPLHVCAVSNLFQVCQVL